MSLYWLNANKIVGLIANTGMGFERPAGDSTGSAVLSEISKATESRAEDDFTPRSIPHPMANSIMMENHLFMNRNTASELCSNIIDKKTSEWRGFISMLALKEVYDIEIYPELVVNSELNNTELGKSLRKSIENKPKAENIYPVIEGYVDYFYLIYYIKNEQRTAIGMTNKDTLFLPGYTKYIFSSLEYPWSDGVTFRDPLKIARDEQDKMLSRGEKIIVYAWINKAIEMIKGEDDRTISVIKLLHDFSADLDLTSNDIQIANKMDISVERLTDIDNNPFDVINIEPKLKSVQNYSDIRINSDSNVIWVDIEKEKQNEKLSKNQRLVCGVLDTAMYINSDNKEEFSSKFHDSSITVYPINKNSNHDLDELLYDTCYYIEADMEKMKDNEIILKSSSSTKVGNRLYILPIKEEVDEATKSILLDILKIKEVSSECIEIECYFGNDKKNFSKKVLDTICITGQDIPATFIWPNVRGSAEYYFNSNLMDTTKGYIFLPCGKELNKDPNKNIPIYQTYILKEYPNMIRLGLCFEKKINTVGYLRLEPLPYLKPKGVITDNPITYSLDFGTSSSVVAKHTVNGIEVLNFENQTVMLTSDEEYGRGYVSDVFFNYGNLPTPVPTMYRENVIPEYQPPKIFRNGHAYFIDKKDFLKELEDEVITDIKFGTHQNLSVEYIKSIVNMILADAKKEGYKKINLIFSYPISISDATSYQSNIKRTINIDYKDNRFNINIDSPKFMTESEAALRYVFHNAKLKDMTYMVVIDIGGGSADLAAHISPEGDAFCSIASIAQGSRKFLLEYFINKPNVFVDLVKQAAENNNVKNMPKRYTDLDEFKKIAKKENKNFYSQIELLLSHEFGDINQTKNFGKELAREFKNSEEDVLRKVRAAWLLQISSYAFYAAMMLGKLCDEKGENRINVINVAFTGKGSAIIDWLPENAVKSLIKKMFYKVASLKLEEKDINVETISQMRKCESAIGMLNKPIVNGQEIYGIENFSFDFVIGEKLKNIENKDSHLSLLPHPLRNVDEEVKDDVIKKLRTKGNDVEIDDRMPILNSFLKLFNENNGNFSKIELKNEKSQIKGNTIIINIKPLQQYISTYTGNFISSGKVDQPIFFDFIERIREEIFKL